MELQQNYKIYTPLEIQSGDGKGKLIADLLNKLQPNEYFLIPVPDGIIVGFGILLVNLYSRRKQYTIELHTETQYKITRLC